MKITKSWELYYTGMTQPQHLLRAAKTNIAANALANADNARLSEYLLKKLHFDEVAARKEHQFTLQNGNSKQNVSAERMLDYVSHIHEKYSDTVRSRFSQPELTDEQAQQLIAEQVLEPELDKVNRKYDIELRL